MTNILIALLAAALVVAIANAKRARKELKHTKRELRSMRRMIDKYIDDTKKGR